MKLIVGLGNPGEKYESTRHNLGFQVVEHFLKDSKSAKEAVWTKKPKLKSEIAIIDPVIGSGHEEKVILAKPTTYMNNSGRAVAFLVNYYKIDPSDLWVVYDELDLPVGTMKIRLGGAAAGHHGVESVIEHVGTDKFWRFRLGIGETHNKEHTIASQKIRGAANYVLGKFKSQDQGKVRELIKRASSSLRMALEKGVENSMNRYNTR